MGEGEVCEGEVWVSESWARRLEEVVKKGERKRRMGRGEYRVRIGENKGGGF